MNYYIRFGEPVHRSINWANETYEQGLCCFPAKVSFHPDGDIKEWSIDYPKGTSRFLKHMSEDWRTLYRCFRAQARPVFLLEGEFAARGRDFEPCIRNFRTITQLRYTSMAS